jgi:proteasome lid subunit RPN8/RPN11
VVSEIRYAPGLLAEIGARCEADPEREVCGFVLRRGGLLEVVPVPNVADRYHAVDPVSFPRTSREAYLMDAKAQLAVHREVAAGGAEIVAVWHSHIECGAYFSEKDRADAIVDGQPVVPGAEYLVFGVRAGRVTEVKRFVIEGGEAVERELR